MESQKTDRIILALLNFDRDVLDNEIINALENIFKRQVIISKKNDLDIETFYNASRNQYYSTDILKTCINSHPPGSNKVVLLTDHDLFIPILTFVFGEAHMHGQYSIVSSYRLYQKFYQLPENTELMKKRLLKEIVHEVGHTFGLKHCFDDKCVMHSSTNIEDTDRKDIYPCSPCFEILDSVI